MLKHASLTAVFALRAKETSGPAGIMEEVIGFPVGPTVPISAMSMPLKLVLCLADLVLQLKEPATLLVNVV